MIWFLYLLISVLTSFGISTVLVKKQDEWPVMPIVKFIKYIFSFIYSKLPFMLDCVVCTSFWVTLLTDSAIYFIFYHSYFAWPMSGFIAVGITYVIIDFLDSFYLLASKDTKNEE